MMRILAPLVFAALLAAPGVADAKKGGGFGVGILLGDPSGLSFKSWIGGQTAIDGGLGFSVRHDWIHVHADYLLHFPQSWAGQDFRPYAGIGGKLAIWGDDDRNRWDDDDSDFAIGVRIPLGIAWHPGAVPIDVFLEFVPAIWVLPGTHVDFDAGLGARWYF